MTSVVTTLDMENKIARSSSDLILFYIEMKGKVASPRKRNSAILTVWKKRSYNGLLSWSRNLTLPAKPHYILYGCYRWPAGWGSAYPDNALSQPEKPQWLSVRLLLRSRHHLIPIRPILAAGSRRWPGGRGTGLQDYLHTGFLDQYSALCRNDENENLIQRVEELLF